MKKLIALAVALLMLYSTAVVASASGGPASGSSTASVTNTAGTGSSYSFGYAFDSTYYGSLSADRPNVSTDGEASVAFSNNVFTITAKSAAGYNPSLSYWDTSAQNVSTEVTITNNSQSTLKIGYTYSATGGTTSGSNLSVGSGTLTWLPGQSIFLTTKTQVTTWTAAASTATATFTITSCEEVVSYDLSIHPSQFGSYTYSVGSDVTGTLASDSDAYTATASASDTVTLSVPEINEAYADEYYFYGWSVNGSVTASSEAYTGTITTHTDLLPVFIKNGTVDESGNGPFYVNGKYYVFWREAFLAAGASYPVVLARDYTLPSTLQENGVAEPDGLRIAGGANSAEYIVPAGSTFLIPYDSANTVVTNGDAVLSAYDTTVTARSQYRALTMVNNTKITVNGSISVGSGKANQFIGQVGPYGAIYMESGSNITVRSGGTLYAWGYIFHGTGGSGTVTVKSGGTVYEPFSIMDYPGSSSATSDIVDADVFPLRSYSIRNVEVEMTIESGAIEYGFSCLYGDNALVGTNPVYIPLIANAAVSSRTPMFQNSGTVTKSYVDGRMIVSISGNFKLNPLSVTLTKGIGTYSLNSSETYGLYIPSCWDMFITSGTTTLNDNVIMCEGSNLAISKTATMDTNGKNIYILDADNDPGAVGNASGLGAAAIGGGWNGCSINIADVHGNYYTFVPKDAVLNINGTLKASGGFYTSAAGACITSSEGGGVVEVTNASSAVTISVKATNSTSSVSSTAAKLLNFDGSFTETANGGTNTYTYSNGYWRCNTHTDTDSDHICDVCKLFPCSGCVEKDPADHTCSICGATMSECKDDDSNSICDICGVNLCAHDNTTVTGQKDATCTEDGYTGDTVCSDCGVMVTPGTTISSAGGHDYETTVNNATCTEDGSTVYTCSGCGDTYSEPIASQGHKGGTATCVAKAECTVCGELYGDLAEHTYSAPVFAWNEGLTEATASVSCSVCPEGTEGRIQNLEVTMSEEATTGDCQNASVTTYTASVTWNGETVSEEKQVTGELGTHSLQKTEAVTATCQKAGNNEYYTCSITNCGKVFKADKTTETTVEAETIAQLDHADTDNDHICNNGCNEKISECSGGTATCMAQAICGTCGKAYGDLGSHTMTHHEAVAPNCTKDGTVEYWSCSVCGKNYADENGTEEQKNIVDPAKGHTPGAAATCTAPQTCTVCGTELTAAKGHSWNDATCTAPKTCSVCKQTEGTANNHSYTSSVTKEATCKEAGVMTYTCVCGESYTEEIAKLTTHTPGAAATCTTAQTCTVCNAELAAALGHTWVDADCDTPKTCSVCKVTEGEAKGHNMQETTAAVAPTCTDLGTTAVLTCANGCGKTEGGEEVAALGHDMQQTAAAVAPTCTAPGSTAVLTCANGCGKTEGGEAVDALDHKDENKDHTCDNGCDVYQGIHTDSATDNDHVCDYCGKEIENGETCSDVTTDQDHKCDICGKEDVTKHEYTSEVTAPTCTTDGYTTHTCNCGHSYTDSKVAANHTIEQGMAQAKTCTQDGWEAYEYCTQCDYSTKVVIPAGHTLTQVEAKTPTCAEKGWEAYEKCSECTHTTYKEIPATGNHTYDNACDADCNVCAATRAPADHVYDNTCDTSCNVCGDVRSITHSWNTATCTAPKTCSVCGATEGEATGHVNTTSSTVQNSDGTHTITVTCGCTYVVSAKTVPCTDAGNGSCVCGRVMAAKVNVENKTKANDNDLYSISGTTLNVKHDLACVVLVKETDGTYTRLNATANANGGYDFAVKSGDSIVIAVKGDVVEDGEVNNKDVFRMKQIANKVGSSATLIQKSVGDLVGNDEEVNNKDVFRIKQLANKVGNAMTW